MGFPPPGTGAPVGPGPGAPGTCLLFCSKIDDYPPKSLEVLVSLFLVLACFSRLAVFSRVPSSLNGYVMVSLSAAASLSVAQRV